MSISVLQHFVCVDSHVPGNPHYFIFCNWQGLMVIPLVSKLYPILPAHPPVYPQDHLVMALPILSLGKLLASTDIVSYCFSGISSSSSSSSLLLLLLLLLLMNIFSMHTLPLKAKKGIGGIFHYETVFEQSRIFSQTIGD